MPLGERLGIGILLYSGRIDKFEYIQYGVIRKKIELIQYMVDQQLDFGLNCE